MSTRCNIIIKDGAERIPTIPEREVWLKDYEAREKARREALKR